MTYLVRPAEGFLVEGLSLAAIEENAPSGLLVGAVVVPHQDPDHPIVRVEIAEVYKWFDENAGHWTVEEENRPSEHFITDGALVYTAKPFDFEMMNYNDGGHTSSVTLSLTLTDSEGVVTVITQDLPVIDLDETVHGGRGNDVLIGTETMNFIYGGAGNDIIKGKSQDDKLYGESGNDRLYGGAGVDILEGGTGQDLLDGGTARSSLRYDGTVTHEANRLIGGAGADRLVDHGDDIFVYTSIKDSLPSARDVIVNWQGKPWIDYYGGSSDTLVAGSVFDLSAIDANTRKAGDQAFRFIGTKDFTGKAGELRYAMAKSHTAIYADVNGDRKADFSIVIDAHTKLTADFFIL